MSLRAFVIKLRKVASLPVVDPWGTKAVVARVDWDESLAYLRYKDKAPLFGRKIEELYRASLGELRVDQDRQFECSFIAPNGLAITFGY